MEARLEQTSGVANSLLVTKFDISGPLVLTPKQFHDERGFLSETFNARTLAPVIGRVEFVQDNHTYSKVAGTVRGLHFQVPPAAQGKLVRVTRGVAYDVAVDIRFGSPTFGRFVAATLSAENWAQFWVPPGFAHGFCTLESQTEVVYKLTTYYSGVHEAGLAWDDPDIGIPWPEVGGGWLLSPKDRAQPRLRELQRYFEVLQLP